MGSRIINFYLETLKRRPYLIQALQTSALMAAGDLISQNFIEQQPLDLDRTLKFSSIGFMTGPTLRAWYGVLNKYVGSKGKSVTIKKVCVDQFLFAPTFLGAFLVTVGTVQGKSWDSVKQELDCKYFDVLKANYYIWPWVQLCNFYYIPLQYQVLVVQTFALFWNTYLAWKTNKKILPDAKDVSLS